MHIDDMVEDIVEAKYDDAAMPPPPKKKKKKTLD